jgi:hypothetical protein
MISEKICSPEIVELQFFPLMGCLPRRENSVRGVGRLSFRRTHKSSGNEASSIAIETLP